MLDVASEVMNSKGGDAPVAFTLRNEKTTAHIYRVERCSFMVVLKNSEPRRMQECKREADVSAALIRKILVMYSNLTGVGEGFR